MNVWPGLGVRPEGGGEGEVEIQTRVELYSILFASVKRIKSYYFILKKILPKCIQNKIMSISTYCRYQPGNHQSFLQHQLHQKDAYAFKAAW